MKFLRFRIIAIFALIPCLVIMQAQQIDAQLQPTVRQAEAYALSPAIRDIKPSAPTSTRPTQEIPLLMPPFAATSSNALQSRADSVVQTDAPSPLAVIVSKFQGLSDDDNAAVIGGRVVPPDTNGDIGPNHYVQWINLIFAVYDRAGNLFPGFPKAGNDLFAALGGPCAATNNGDPIVLYDEQADRWLVSQFALPGGAGHQCIGISQTSDPTGAYHLYDFLISPTEINDYPKFGVWPDGYYASFNMFGPGFTGVKVASFERAKMLVGNPAALMVLFDLPFVGTPTEYSMLPSDLDGPPPPPGTPNFFAEVEAPELFLSPTDQLGIYEFAVDFSNPPASTFTRVATLVTAPFAAGVCGFSRDCIPQRGTTQRVDALSDRLMHRLQYRNFGGHASMVTNHTVNVGGDRAGIRWYELRDKGGGWFIRQQGTYAPGAHISRWMASTAMNRDGTIALGYSASSSSIHPSIAVTGRLSGDALGTMRGEVVLFAGRGSQLNANRWGDYSMMSVDPVDDKTFWYTQETYVDTAAFDFKTGVFKITPPSPPGPIGSGVAAAASPVLTETQLEANYPNPFNPETWIPYQISDRVSVSIGIYDVGGSLIRTLDLGEQDTGKYMQKSRAAHWDGRNQKGEIVPGGIYFYTLTAGDFQSTRKMVVVK